MHAAGSGDIDGQKPRKCIKWVTLLSPTNRGISSIHEPRNKSDNTDKNGDMHLHTKEVIFNM